MSSLEPPARERHPEPPREERHGGATDIDVPPELAIPRLTPGGGAAPAPRAACESVHESGLESGWHLAKELPESAWHLAAEVRLLRSEDGGVPAQGTRVLVGWTPQALHLRFDCRDTHPWSTFTARDEPLWQEEVVELFLSFGAEDPERYFEIEVNPLGTLFDARIENPGLERRALQADLAFDWPEIAWQAGLADDGSGWWAMLSLPWGTLAEPPWRAEPGAILRGNLYRVDRPRQGPPEHSAWSPTFCDPADFHRPRRFGRFVLAA